MSVEKKPAGGAGNENPKAAVQENDENAELRKNLARIKNKIIVLSGKGGVGKSTVAVNLAFALARRKLKTGLLDVDIHGPSVPVMLGMRQAKPQGTEDGKIFPVEYNEYLKVISVGFLLNEADEAVIWRGPLKYSAIKQFLKDVLWNELDYLIVDSPPGTGDEPLSVCQLMENPTGAIVVTTPQDVALSDVRKSITFCRKLNMPVLGVVENMSGFVCPHCGKQTDIFKSEGGRKMAAEMGVPFLGSIPMEARIVDSGDEGNPYLNGDDREEAGARSSFARIVDLITKGE
ncbi:MAG TPA: ATP-binding protein [Spirochaetes bacterium]|nr:ATP-binding protein [Spirochaetota bacterium]